MVKKKGHLWLSKPKRRKTSKDGVIICALMESFSNKRSSTLTPKLVSGSGGVGNSNGACCVVDGNSGENEASND